MDGKEFRLPRPASMSHAPELLAALVRDGFADYHARFAAITRRALIRLTGDVTLSNPNGDKLGSVESLLLDKLSGKVRYAVMEFGGFLGLGTDVYPLPWETLKYDTGLGGYVVSLTKEQLEGAPRYARETTQDYNDEYGRKVNEYYGVPWI